jgi:hypothetical protein
LKIVVPSLGGTVLPGTPDELPPKPKKWGKVIKFAGIKAS